jgi:hypothetical protein
LEGEKMSLLKPYAKKPEKKEKSKTATVRLPLSLLEDFQSYCKDLNLPVSQAVRLLIEYELTGRKKNENFRTEETQILKQVPEKVIYEKDTVEIPKKTEAAQREKKEKRVGVSTGKRFTTKPWEIDGELPCPICGNGKWTANGNIDRHFKNDHGTKRREVFNNPEYLKIADEMHAERLERDIN